MEEQIRLKKEKPDREHQTFFRVTFKNNCNLLQIADNKANIIISINALVISSLVAIMGYGTISHQVEIQNPITLAPVLLLITACFISTILAVQSAKPKIMGNKRGDDTPSKSSIMFFGSSEKLSMDEYLFEVNRILPSKKEIQEQMSIALFYQAKVLNKKYSLLRHAYNVFIIGLGLGIITFLIFLSMAF
ncbi:Pycsar system effector family protein [Algoriphagus sp. SE2]|uniref:Pycsar system effector family protein n=1 Tax=Algoriphagus sp. SE2 TaxID=3141536 RepID=UPI0031CD1F04